MSEPYNDIVSEPSHYKHPSGVECKEIIYDLPMWLANPIKYVWRHPHKGKPVEDLRKAQECLKDATPSRLEQIQDNPDMDHISGKALKVLAHEPLTTPLYAILDMFVTSPGAPTLEDVEYMEHIICDEIVRYVEYGKETLEAFYKETR